MTTASPTRSNGTTTKAVETCEIPCFNRDLVAAVKRSLPADHAVQKAAALYGALADPTRLKILLALAHGELCVCDVAHVVGLSVSATSHQLRVLRTLGLVRFRNEGRMAYYSLPAESPVLGWIARAVEDRA